METEYTTSNIKNKEYTEDEIVSIYYQISNYTVRLTEEKRDIFIKYLEEYYLDESETELGDFIDEMAQIYVYDIQDEDLHLYIRECIDVSELNYEMLYCVGKYILEIVEYIVNYN